MADGSHEGAEGDAEDTDELLYTDLDEDISVYRQTPGPLKQDHCDLLLDAIDAQLSRLQVQSHSQSVEGISQKYDCTNTAPLSWSQSLSKDTGLGSTIPSHLFSCLDLVHPENKDLSSEKSSGGRVGPVGQEEKDQRTETVMKGEEEDVESRREQCHWRLERLLGEACGGGLAGEKGPPPDSVCTEDFATRFTEEMVGLPDSTMQRLARDEINSLGNSCRDKESERTADTSESGTCHADPKREGDLTAAREEDVHGEDRVHTEHHQQASMDKQSQIGWKKQSVHSHGVRRLSRSANPRARESSKAPQRLSGLNSGDSCLHSSVALLGVSAWTHSEPLALAQGPSVSVVGPPSSSSSTVILTASLEPEGTRENRSHAPRTRHLAGVPVCSFDTVTIDSDLDSVRTERVRQHIHNRPGCLSAIHSVRDMDGLCTDLSDYDTPTQEPRGPHYISALRASHGKVTSGSLPLRKPRPNRRDTPRYARSVGEDDDDTDDGCVRWKRRRRPDRATGVRLSMQRSGGQLVEMRSDCVQMEEELSTLRQDCEKEAERLRLKRAQMCEMEHSLADLLQKRKHAMQELEQLCVGAEQMEREGRSLEASLRDSRAEADSTSSQLRRLQRQRDSCLQEVRDLEEEQAALHTHRTALQDGSYGERRHTSVSVSVLEREEIDRQLDSAKTELFAEQRRSRIKLDSMQEKLEEAREELQRLTAEEKLLRDRCAGLEDKQRQKQEQEEAADLQVCELQRVLQEREGRVGALERIVAQKELQLLGFQEEHSALQAERDDLQGELQSLREQHSVSLREAQEQAHRDRQRDLEQLKDEMTLAHEQQIQQAKRQAEEEKADALREQALSHVQFREEEGGRLREALEQQKTVMRRHEEELRVEAQEMTHTVIEQEQRKWEAEKEVALKVQCGILEEQGREALERARVEMEREKRSALALQNKVVELQTTVQELESEGHVLQREQSSALAAMRRSLREEHQAELQRVRRHAEQEGQREALRLEQAVEQAEEKAGRLQRLLAEREHSHKQSTARLEQQLRHWAQELGTECQHIHNLLEHSMAFRSTMQLPHSPTLAQAVQTLQALREQLQHLISHLQQELDSQRRTTQQLSWDKERELCIQKDQMGMEREQALDSLKERLIQEHIEELSSLNRAQMREEGDEAGGVAASLRRQLQDKNQEMRQVQRSMGQWKEQTTARLARKFEEELTAELERKAPKARDEKQRKLEILEGEMRHITGGCNDSGAQRSASSPSLHTGDLAASPAPSDLASFKLLRHLQSRVRQLRAENQAHTCSPPPLSRTPLELAGSYLETITPSRDCDQFWSSSRVRTVQS